MPNAAQNALHNTDFIQVSHAGSLPRTPALGVEPFVKVPHVAVHGADPQAGRVDLGRHGFNRGRIEFIRNVVANAGQGAQIDLSEAQALHGAQGSAQVLVPEADG